MQIQDEILTTPLIEAVKCGDFEACQQILQCDSVFHIDQRNFQKQTALLVAARLGHLTICELLLDNGASLNRLFPTVTSLRKRFCCYSDTPLIVATRNGHEDICRLLLERGADITITDNIFMTPASIALLYNHIKIYEMLIDHSLKKN